MSDLPLFSAYANLPFVEQVLHGLHFMLCTFAVMVACIPLLTAKGSVEHKFAGFIYLPLSFAALVLASVMAWREASFVLFCFNAFCAYLLLGGWRALHEKEKPGIIDWTIPVALFALSIAVMLHAMMYDEGVRSFYMLSFAINGFYMALRDVRHLNRRAAWSRYKKFFGDGQGPVTVTWLSRHVAGMIGSVIANMSVIVLTLLPLKLHWLWAAALILAGAVIAWKERQKKQRVRQMLAPVLKPDFARGKKTHHDPSDDIRRAA